jgi:P pilus assembly chaperone PapD
MIAADLFGSVLVAPTVVILSEKERTGRMILHNPTDRPQEVTIAFRFGLPSTDSLGNVRVLLEDSTYTDPRSCIDWVRAFPKKVVVPPGGEQTVRFVASPPADLPDGEYWSRILVTAKGVSDGPPKAGEDAGISAVVNMIVQTAVSLKYRTGELVSELEVTNVETTLMDKAVEIMADLTNKGNVSYLGKFNCRLLDADAKEINSVSIDIAVYRSMRRRFIVTIPDSVAANLPYRAEIAFTTEGRTDIPTVDMIHAREIAFEFDLKQ